MTDSTAPPIDDFNAVLTPRERSPGLFVLDVRDGWQQGRGAFGGLVLGALARALEMSEPDRRRKIRSLNAEIAGPVVPGEALIEVTELRRGNGLSALNATLSQEGRGLARASAVLARSRGGDPPKVNVPTPALRAWTEVPIVAMEQIGQSPTFTRHLEFRPTGPLPFVGSAEPACAGWVRPKRLHSIGAPEVVALADAWWPGSLAQIAAFRPLGTVAFAIQIFLPETPLDPAEPVYYQGRILAEHEGYMNEQRELWTADGRLLALNQQNLAWIR
jgi:acyl-CoA thioesterase